MRAGGSCGRLRTRRGGAVSQPVKVCEGQRGLLPCPSPQVRVRVQWEAPTLTPGQGLGLGAVGGPSPQGRVLVQWEAAGARRRPAPNACGPTRPSVRVVAVLRAFARLTYGPQCHPRQADRHAPRLADTSLGGRQTRRHTCVVEDHERWSASAELGGERQ